MLVVGSSIEDKITDKQFVGTDNLSSEVLFVQKLNHTAVSSAWHVDGGRLLCALF